MKLILTQEVDRPRCPRRRGRGQGRLRPQLPRPARRRDPLDPRRREDRRVDQGGPRLAGRPRPRPRRGDQDQARGRAGQRQGPRRRGRPPVRRRHRHRDRRRARATSRRGGRQAHDRGRATRSSRSAPTRCRSSCTTRCPPRWPSTSSLPDTHAREPHEGRSSCGRDGPRRVSGARRPRAAPEPREQQQDQGRAAARVAPEVRGDLERVDAARRTRAPAAAATATKPAGHEPQPGRRAGGRSAVGGAAGERVAEQGGEAELGQVERPQQRRVASSRRVADARDPQRDADAGHGEPAADRRPRRRGRSPGQAAHAEQHQQPAERVGEGVVPAEARRAARRSPGPSRWTGAAAWQQPRDC